MTWLWIILVLLYVVSRFDLVPDFLIGWGWIDDIIVLVLLYRYLAKKHRTRSGPQQPHNDQQRQSDRQTHTDQDGQTFARPRSPYAVLELSPDATPTEIRAAYRRLANQYHPDKVSHLGREFQELAEQRFKEIQQAYQELTGGRQS